MSSKNFVFALYRPTNEDNQSKVVEILKKQILTLRKYELIKDTSAYLLQSENGTIIQIWEWQSKRAMKVAHEHPAIRTIWGEMHGICEFTSLKDLPESATRFPAFKILENIKL